MKSMNMYVILVLSVLFTCSHSMNQESLSSVKMAQVMSMETWGQFKYFHQGYMNKEIFCDLFFIEVFFYQLSVCCKKQLSSLWSV